MRLSYTTYRLQCTHPFGISRSSYDYYDRVFIYLEQDGIIGRGEAAPSERYGESIPQILNKLKNKIILPNSVAYINDAVNIIENFTYKLKSLRSAIIGALFDWCTQKLGQPLYKYFGFDNVITKPTSFTIAIGKMGELEQKIKEANQYHIFKVKLGTKQDKEIVKTIRKYTNKPIRVDANEGWDLETAMEMIDWLSEQNVDLVEQPLPVADFDKMSELKKHASLPLIADENCHTTEDIKRLVDGFDGINIKLAKCGGVDEASKMIEIAKKNDLKVMLGCMVESTVGISTIAQFASLADFLDIDGNLLIDNDPYKGVQIKNGVPMIPTGTGIGVSLINDYKNNFPDLR